MMTGIQIRAARKLLNWTPERLAKHARIGVGIVLQAERDGGIVLISPAAARSIQNVLEEAGIERVGPAGLVQLRQVGNFAGR
jgi:hypothetical protein